MEQKVIRIGSSIGIVIPKPLAQERGITVGSKVKLKSSPDSNNIIIEPHQIAPQNKEISDAVARATVYVEKYRKDFEALADK